MKQDKQWVKPRHRFVRNLLYVLLYPYIRLRYGITIEKLKEQGDRQYVVLLNHQTPFDQFFLGVAFKGAVYYLATEDIFSLGWISSVIRYLVAPIPIKKQAADSAAVRNCIRVARQGGTIAIAPEGNRTYSGRTEYMNPTIVPLVKKLGLPVALFRIEGGYGVEPRWSDVKRRGKMRASVSRVIEPEELRALSDDQVMDIIREGLAVDEAKIGGEYHHKKSAEYVERALYVCPFCGFSKFESHGDTFACCTCHRQMRYLPNKQLEGIGFALPHHDMGEWYHAQYDFVNAWDPRKHTETPVFTDVADLYRVIVYKHKERLHKAVAVALYGDRIAINEGTADEMVFPFEEITAIAVLGRNKLNVYHGEQVYQLKGDKRFNALKYVNLCYRYKNISRGEENGIFLGL